MESNFQLSVRVVVNVTLCIPQALTTHITKLTNIPIRWDNGAVHWHECDQCFRIHLLDVQTHTRKQAKEKHTSLRLNYTNHLKGHLTDSLKVNAVCDKIKQIS